MVTLEQIGDYVLEQLRPGALWRVRMAGSEELLSAHDTKAKARKAIERHQAADRRRQS